ncbi:hypothetical protein G7Z17_g4367 [Cylindrodendrum hubeiense]|uniref:Uncharacterized protein n=1 Tax=Cylindrodendrum hubeiense TaxID=595255 RepID=A0A9P5LH97_9HYPO|nr:hypothetical protein G7Z17_g4367 [Cylindrodendrum hubeiense]
MPCLNPDNRPKIFGRNQTILKTFAANAREILAQGRKMFAGQPFKVTTDSGEIVVLPPQFINDIRNEPKLSFMTTLAQDFHAHIPGFEPFAAGSQDDELLQLVSRKQLTKMLNKVTKPLSDETNFATELAFGSPTECRLIRGQVAQARKILLPVVQQRREARQQAIAEGKQVPSFDDALDWFEDESKGRDYDPVMCQLMLSFVAIHTTTDLMTEVMLKIAENSDLFDSLRKEITDVLRAEGWKKSALADMKLLDSVIKESQRLRPISLISMRRAAAQDVTLPNGMILRKDQRCMVDASLMRDPDIYSQPDDFDGHRFKRMRSQAGQENQAHLVSTGPASLGFGHGNHACPGRFFAANEIKVALCHLIMKYDWKLAPGCVPKALENGLVLAVDPNARVEIRRREPEIDIDAL